MPGGQHTHDLRYDGDRVTKVFSSWDRGEPDREWDVLALLHEHARGLAPEPIDRLEVEGRPAVVMSRIPGEPLGAESLTPRQLDAVGDALARLYAVPVAAVAHLGERVHGPADFPGSVTGWLEDAAGADLTGCREPALVAEAVAAAGEWLAAPDEALAAGAGPVLSRADGNPANLMWDGERVRLLDFEDSGLSDRAFELADLVEHVALRLPGLADPAAVAAAVGVPAGEQERLLACRRLHASFWLAMLLPGAGGFRRNPPGSTEAQARHLLDLLPAR
ncbi:phosphotransferase [Nocardioides sp. GCM10027113]|uniref:phosphotransferase n=1 Tax=unclassified Nocardioides TaxID=2615069 RepID=UPI00362075AE